MADNWQLKAILSAVDKMSPVLKNVSQTARSTRKYLADVGSSSMKLADQIGVPLGLLSGAASALSVAGLKKIVQDFADSSAQITDASRGLGLTTTEYQRLGFIAEQSGTNIEALGSSLGKLNQGIALAAAGKNKDLAALFQQAGISVRDANGQLRSATDLLPQVADLFARNGNVALQARMGTALFGRSWQQLAPLLNDGSAGILELTERYRQLGLEVDQASIAAGDQFSDKLGEAQRVVNSYSYAIGAKLLPVLAPLLEKTIQWAVQNRELIATKVSTFVSDMAKALARVDWNAVVKGVGDIVAGVRTFVGWIGGAKNALIALVVVMNAQAVVAAAALGMAVLRLSFHFAALAVKAYIAGNAALLALARTAVMAIAVAGPIGAIGAAFTWMAGMAAGAGGIISGAMGMVSLAIKGIGAALLANPLGIILGLATAAVLIYQNWGTLKEWFSSFFSWVGDKFQSLVGWAVDLAKAVGGLLGGGDSSPGAGGGAMGPSVIPSRQLVGPQSRGRVEGGITIDINGLTPGSRVAQTSGKGDMPIDLNAGYSSAALGMP